MKYLRTHNIIAFMFFEKNRFTNQCVKKNFLKFPERETERRKDGVFLCDVEELKFFKKIEGIR